ncbi:MAG: LysM peptidoglycan-binding domain-containing M23 family metallopeptidase [Rhodobacter sp.]|nr:LysM peptidoglycan-binding domain-containing M23 family metallopeptidase [Rhodobacter sp.]
MIRSGTVFRLLALGAAFGAISACSDNTALIDWDLRPDGAGAFSTADAARRATATRPEPDANGVISYPGYQVAVARQGDTVSGVAERTGIDPAELATYNAMSPDTPLNAGEILALPRRVGTSSSLAAGATVGAPIQSGTIEVTTLAAGAIDRAQSGGTDAAPAPAPLVPGGVEPIRHRVERGETAYSIARLYSVTARSIAEWNGLGPDLAVREGQYLLIPVPLDSGTPDEVVTQPGEGSPTPPPPSAAKPLPDEKITPAAEPAPETPPSPKLEEERSSASAARFAMPANGSIIRGYVAGKVPGIDIGAAAGSPVKAAADGTVAAITKDTSQVSILILRHADNILTVYANIDGITVAKGDRVKRGQTIAAIRDASPAFLRFEVRNGIDAVDPMPFLQ